MNKRAPIGLLDILMRNNDGSPPIHSWFQSINNHLQKYNMGLWQNNLARHYYCVDILNTRIPYKSKMFNEIQQMLAHSNWSELTYYQRFDEHQDKILVFDSALDFEQSIKIDIKTGDLTWSQILDACNFGDKKKQLYFENLMSDDWDEEDIGSLLDDRQYLRDTIEMSAGHVAKFVRIAVEIGNGNIITAYQLPSQISPTGGRFVDLRNGYVECIIKQILQGNMFDRKCMMNDCTGVLEGMFAGYASYKEDAWEEFKNNPNRADFYNIISSHKNIIMNHDNSCNDPACDIIFDMFDDFFMKCNACNYQVCPYSLVDYDEDNPTNINVDSQPWCSMFGTGKYKKWITLLNNYRKNHAKLYLTFSANDKKREKQIKHNEVVISAKYLFKCEKCNLAFTTPKAYKEHKNSIGCLCRTGNNWKSSNHKHIEHHMKSCKSFIYKSVNVTMFKTYSPARTIELIHFILFSKYGVPLNILINENNSIKTDFYLQEGVCSIISGFAFHCNQIAWLINAHKMDEDVINNVIELKKMFKRGKSTRRQSYKYWKRDEKIQAGKWYLDDKHAKQINGINDESSNDNSDDSSSDDSSSDGSTSDKSWYYFSSSDDSDNSSDDSDNSSDDSDNSSDDSDNSSGERVGGDKIASGSGQIFGGASGSGTGGASGGGSGVGGSGSSGGTGGTDDYFNDVQCQIDDKIKQLSDQIDYLHNIKLKITSAYEIKGHKDFVQQEQNEQATLMDIVDKLEDMRNMNPEYYNFFVFKNDQYRHLMDVWKNDLFEKPWDSFS
eukprot:172233_1